MNSVRSKEIRENPALKDFMSVVTSRNTKPSATLLTGVSANTALLGKYQDFVNCNRQKKFCVEDYYLIKKDIPEEEPKVVDAPITDYRTAQGIEEVIHVTIDRSSLR